MSKDITNLLVSDSSSDFDSNSHSESEIPDVIDSSEAEQSAVPNDLRGEQFPNLNSDSEEEESNKILKTEVKRKGTNFNAMGLSKLLLTNVQRVGYKVPTPIQRKAMPPILDGQDVVAMARTGSGKTAAFIIPMIERLFLHKDKKGLKALILSPNRELAMQTYKVVRDFSRKTELKSVFLVGGDSMDDQFGMMLDNPDIVVATPGRFLHLKVEMGLSLGSCEYVVFDEADRLFEMGFSEQLSEVLSSLPESRQTLLFSATLPPDLVQFAKAGLKNPLLVRLDAEQKISDELQMGFFSVKDTEREAALLYLLQNVINLPMMSEEQRKYLEKRNNYDPKFKQKREKEATAKDIPTPESTIVFVPTKHHVEYITNLLKQEGYAVSYIYGSLDQAARREQLYLFKAGKTSVMVVTDVAARGVDVPLLANVVNYNIPTSARVFVHRVGRTARAGHSGWAYTLVREQDLPYLVDLEVFLGRKIRTSTTNTSSANGTGHTHAGDYTKQLVLGSFPRMGIESAVERFNGHLSRDIDDLQNLQNVAFRGEKMYLRSREPASKQGIHKAKEELINTGLWETLHPLVADIAPQVAAEDAKNAFLARLNNNRNRETVFEFKKTGALEAAQMMARRREQIKPIQDRLQKKREVRELEQVALHHRHNQDDDDADGAASADQNYMSYYEPKSVLQERGYDFNTEAGKTAFQVGDEGGDFSTKQITRWDKKRGKYVKEQSDSTKYIKGENGVRIPASLKSGRFENWKKANKITDQGEGFSVQRRFKHKKLKAPKPADKARDDYGKRKAKIENAAQRGVNVKGYVRPTTGLKSTEDIQKERSAKQKRWEKSNQPGTNSKSKSKSKSKSRRN